MTGWSRVRLGLGIVVVVIATASILVGLVAAAAAAGVHAVVGQSGILGQNLGVLAATPPGVAVLVDGVEASISADGMPRTAADALAWTGTSADDLVAEYGDFVLLAVPTGEGEAFLGIADPSAIDAYLVGAPYVVAERGADGAWRSVDVPGDGSPSAPGAAIAWTAASTGRPAVLDADGLAGRTLVLMRPDASPGVSADLRLEYRVPQAPRALQSLAIVAGACGVGGLLLALLGCWLIVGRRPPGRHA